MADAQRGEGVKEPGAERGAASLVAAYPFDIEGAKARLAAENGGYEVVHESPGLELGVYVLVAPEPDRQQAHDVIFERKPAP